MTHMKHNRQSSIKKGENENLFSFFPNAVEARLPRGLTLVEMLVTIGIFAIIMVTLVNSIIIFYRANGVAIEQSYQIESARRGIELLVRDLRESTYGDNGAFPLASIASTSITFYSDTDRDSVAEQMHYELSGTTLTRSVVNPSGNPIGYSDAPAVSPVSTYVRNDEEGTPIFRYYNVLGNEISDYNEIVNVVFIKVSLVVNIRPVRAPEEFTLKSSATLRNLRPQ